MTKRDGSMQTAYAASARISASNSAMGRVKNWFFKGLLIGERCEEVFEIALAEPGGDAAAAEQSCGELLLFLLQAQHALFDAAGDDQVVHEHRLGLPDAIGTIGGLRLRGGIPPRIVVNHSVGAGQIEPGAARLEADQKNICSP